MQGLKKTCHISSVSRKLPGGVLYQSTNKSRKRTSDRQTTGNSNSKEPEKAPRRMIRVISGWQCMHVESNQSRLEQLDSTQPSLPPWFHFFNLRTECLCELSLNSYCNSFNHVPNSCSFMHVMVSRLVFLILYHQNVFALIYF